MDKLGNTGQSRDVNPKFSLVMYVEDNALRSTCPIGSGYSSYVIEWLIPLKQASHPVGEYPRLVKNAESEKSSAMESTPARPVGCGTLYVSTGM